MPMGEFEFLLSQPPLDGESLPSEEYDPEGWREYADIKTPEQLEGERKRGSRSAE
jgi:hypothetical protein